ncbi:MAG: TonB-dependent receptor [Omnitrophica bacterium]|nr:TonB-dependent receptor [Candidatus Omnitrophota bacterium]
MKLKYGHLNLSLFLILFLGPNMVYGQEDSYEINLEQIIVTPSKIEQEYRDSTQNVSVVSSDDIESKGALTVSEVLDLLPSLDIVEYGSVGALKTIHVRGSTPSQVLVLVDGRPLNNPRDGVADLNEISLANIERIEVLRGPASSMYGNSAVGGVVNIITKSGTDTPQTELTTKFGSFSTKAVLFSHGYKIANFDYFISYEYLASHGHRDNSDYLSNNINTKLGYEIGDGHHISFSSGYFNGELGTPGTLSAQDLDDRQESFDKYYDLTYKGSFFEGQKHTLKLFNKTDRLEFIETFNPLDKSAHTTKLYGVDGHYSQQITEEFRTAIGYTYQNNRFNSSVSGKKKYNFKALYSDSELNLLDWLALIGGVRWDKYSNFGSQVSPSGGFNWWLWDKLKLHLIYGEAFRAPTFNDLWWPSGGGVAGNPNLKPEKTSSGEVGFTTYLSDNFNVDFTFFKTRYVDLIEWAPDNGDIWRPSNVNTAITQGFEIEADYLMPDKLKANFNYTYLESKDLSTKKWLRYRPRHTYKLRASFFPQPQFEAGFTTRYRTKVFTDPANTAILKHYFLMDLHFSYDVNEEMKIFFDINNLFDLHYKEQNDYSLPGRAFYGGVKLSF